MMPHNISVTIDSNDTHNDYVCHSVEVLHEADNHQILIDQKLKSAGDRRRFQIFDYYWSLGSLQRQRDWIAKSVIKKEVKTHTTDKGDSSRRNCTYEYYINEEGRRQVCQKFLLSTLDVTQRFILYTLKNASEGFSKIDGRKNNGGRNRTSEDVINNSITFIKLLPLVPSHYCRKDSTRLYLPSEFKNISNLYRIYTKYCDDGNVKTMSFKVFSNWLRENYNIGFHIPEKDKCTICMTQTYDVKKAEDMASYNSHLQEKDESYKRFKFHENLNAVDSTVICASFDMQKVLNTPHGENNMALYYTRKIAVYNFTIYESNTQKGYGQKLMHTEAQMKLPHACINIFRKWIKDRMSRN
uniref:Uncharacterized protein n=1 Tax=Bombyx mori TaxID=7091 RepID=A0A8R2R265_BOMMO|nr:uncharacterized protein LOC110386562 [Bombyx mori]XP_037873864.1 uncharacterized protein LOC110386562 [Bombyx mori]XP_037873865.1 uncharacterized protein LOC110386562 [Bombyx mori]